MTEHALQMIGQPSVDAAIHALAANAPGGFPNEAVLLEALQRLP